MRASFVWTVAMGATVLALGVYAGASVAASAAVKPPSPVTTAIEPPLLATPQFRRYGVADGLPSGSVYSVVQDRHGLMWFGSAGGLVRFDGVGFKVFRHVVGDPASLPSNQTYALFVDHANRVWAGGVLTGLSVYDQSSNRFRHWQHDGANPASLVNNEVWSIAETPDGRLWVATQGGLERMRADARGFEHMTLDAAGPPGTPFGPTRALLAEANGRLWIGTERGLYLRQANGALAAVPVDPAFHGDIGTVWHIEGRHGEVRVAVTGGLLVIGADGVARPLANRQLAPMRILSSVRDPRGRLWIGSLTGIMLDAGSGPLQHIGAHPLLPGGLPSDHLWQVFRDTEGGLWFTFEQSSIAYLAPGWDGFSRYTHIPDDPASLRDVAALSVQASRDGKLWVGGFNGWVDKLDVRSGRVQHVLQGLSGGVSALAEDTRGRLWLLGPGQLSVYDRGKLTKIDPQQMHMARPVALAVGDGGQVYAASWGDGVLALDPERTAATPMMARAELGDTAFPGQLSMHDGRLWYASSGGLQRGDEHNRRLLFVPGLPRREVFAFDFDPDGGLWTLNDRALDHYRFVRGNASRIDHIDLRQHAFAANLRTLRVDRQGEPWLFADPGLWRFDPATRRFTEFGLARGLSSADFSNGSTVLTHDGTLFAASGGGVMAFQPRRLELPLQLGAMAPLLLTRLAVRRDGHLQTVALDQLAVEQPVVHLRWDDLGLSVSTRLASFVDPAANRYRSWLHGFDTGWVDATSPGDREFAGLRGGTYTLEVEAAGAGGRWRSLTAPLRIEVQAPPWTRWWAWCMYALFAAAMLGSILLAWRRRITARHHLQLLEQQRQMAEAASAAKTQFLATLSHEIRTPMTGVMGMAELLLGTPLTGLQHDYTLTMQRSGGMLLKLLNDALDLSRIEAGRLQLELAPFNPRELLHEVMALEFGPARLKGIQLQLEIAASLPQWLLGDGLRIRQVLLNLVNNALKFTPHGSVAVAAQGVAGGVQFSVGDTGPGIPEASRARLFQRFEQEVGPQQSAGSGLGLAICRELVSLMDGSIELESRVGGGSIFRVRVPLVESVAGAVPVRAGVRGDVRHGHLLLVEDDTIVAAVLCGLLEAQGHVVCRVVNALAALAELARTPFDALLLDLDLPGVNGFQLARLIRRREQAPQRIPIVAITAHAGGDDEALTRAAGMDGFLRKPLTGERLADALAQVLRPVSVPVPLAPA